MYLLYFSCPGFLGESYFVGRGRQPKNVTEVGLGHTNSIFFIKDDFKLQCKSSSKHTQH